MGRKERQSGKKEGEESGGLKWRKTGEKGRVRKHGESGGEGIRKGRGEGETKQH